MKIIRIFILTYILFFNLGCGNKYDKGNQFPIVSLWRVSCDNSLTLIDIESDYNAYLSLYSNNSIYINVQVNKSTQNSSKYEMKFKSIESQTIYYKNKKKINEKDISQTNPIATFTVKGNKLNLEWIGLYNMKSKSLEFVDDAVFINENDGKNPIVFERCN